MAAAKKALNDIYRLSTKNIVDNQQALIDFIHWIIVFIVIPAISIFGVIANTLSIIVLYRHGFRKSSNILLFVLAIGDITFLIGVNGPPKVMYEWGRGGFWFPESSARVLYYFYHFFDIINWGSGPASMCLPALITIERLVAVYWPLKFNLVFTPRRTLVVALMPFVFFYGIQAYIRAWYQFLYVIDTSYNVTRGLAARSQLYWNQKAGSDAMKFIFNSMIVFVLFVGCGNIAIGVKVKLAANRRSKMTNTSDTKQGKSEANTARTTKMLLCVCAVYTVAMIFVTFPVFKPGLMAFPLFLDEPDFRSVSVFTYHVFKVALCINSSCNFIIYVAMSKKFRDTLMELVCCKS